MEPQVICIVGPSCAGKTTAADIISELTGVMSIQASSYPRERHKRSGSNSKLLDYVSQVFAQTGRDTFAKDLLSDLRKERNISDSRGVIIDGFRAVEELELIAKETSLIATWGVFANAKTRFERNLNRDGAQAIQDYQEFIRKDMMEYGFGIANILTACKEDLIVNEGTLLELRTELGRLVSLLDLGVNHRFGKV